jgi:hypothetical protein
MIGTEVSTEDEGRLLQFLRNNQDVLAWSKSDLTGVHRSVIEHALNTDPKVKPKLQRQRPMSGDRVKSAKAEVQKLLDARIIREVQYPVWVANVVMVPKKNDNMRMCIDFTELNKACPKDPYPLPRIDVTIDQAAGCDMLSLLDCFSGYHQVWMRREDEAKTGFTTPFDIFCFARMPEGLHNAESTFNCMMKLILGCQLGRNASAYVDDIVIMSEREKDVTPAFLAPNKSPNKSCVFSKLSSRAQLPPSNPSHCPSLSPRRACRESRRHRPHPGQRPRVPSQRRGRPPCRESRARRGPAGRSASPSPSSRKSRRRPENHKIPHKPFPYFP